MKLLSQSFNKSKIRIFCGIILWVLLFCGCSKEEALRKNVSAGAESKPESCFASMVVLGDNLMHMPVVNDGKKPDGSYDYSHIFANIREDISVADIAVIGQETILGGEELGLSGYPLFNSPTDVGKTLCNEGFDVVLHASNHVLDRGIKGIEKTLEFWKGCPNVNVLGINENEDERDKATVIERNGLTFALFNYTYGTNGIPLPDGYEYAVSLIDEQKIEEDIKAVDSLVDFVVVYPHWGNEYQMSASDYQKELAEKMCGWGADAIIGSHPHVIQPCERIKSENGNECVVFYSLGNFVSRQKNAENLLGGMATLEFSKIDGVKNVKAKFTPIVTHYDFNSRNFAVFKLKDYTDELAQKHGINLYDGKTDKKRFEDIFDSVFSQMPDGIEFEL